MIANTRHQRSASEIQRNGQGVDRSGYASRDNSLNSVVLVEEGACLTDERENAYVQGVFVKMSQKGPKTAETGKIINMACLTQNDLKLHFLTQKRAKITCFDPKTTSNDRILPQNTTF